MTLSLQQLKYERASVIQLRTNLHSDGFWAFAGHIVLAELHGEQKQWGQLVWEIRFRSINTCELLFDVVPIACSWNFAAS
jgi:hypothetical protein